MNTEIKDKIAKVLELANRGIEGEKDAAQNALNRLMKKYNLSDEDLSKIKLTKYFFKYKTNLDMMLFQQILKYFFEGRNFRIVRHTYGTKELAIELEYLDWVTVDSAYEYFRRHAASQFKEFCLPHVKRCRTTKTKNAKREELQTAFFSKYVIASNIYHPEQIEKIDHTSMSNKERETSHKRAQILGDVEGGQFHTQVGKETKMLN